ncbi:DUF1203 domain-containing protein [Alisedimentitalea sp. MJ-SS2]|uniref:DUF1203 domain-containing protein n=1 Tax=Aliisedimentitalea sp. MJ-SS2 TaxID=3049795 RepID=UPI00290EAE88|nr:DUF1203 domain-containing protein [Alisedimentitalea sp. MJ-SS2]MDU8927645.1 DUF1203 domain-containing protein [Alisedimentitalea sp. MJ-SS2]
MSIRFLPIPTETATAYRNGAPDAYGNPPERMTSKGTGNPCRHCLDFIPDGAEMLVVAYSPFGARQPYAETGPIFLCADDCATYDPHRGVPAIFDGNTMLIRAYSRDERILYGTGEVVAPDAFTNEIAARLARDDVAFVHVRSSTNNCFQARVERSD